jgi:hypothetical protein
MREFVFHFTEMQGVLLMGISLKQEKSNEKIARIKSFTTFAPPSKKYVG